MSRFFLIVMILLLGGSTSFAQLSSMKVNSASESLEKNGVYYALPHTVLRVDIKLNKTELVSGPYAAYATEVLGISNYIMRDETSYSIKEVAIHSFSEADPKNFYYLSFGERSSKADRNFLLQLQANGVLKGMNETTAQNEEDRMAKLDLRQDYFSHDFNYYADINQYEKIDTVIRRMSVDTSTIEDVVYNRSEVQKTMLQRAQDAAKAYMDIHKNRLELLSGFQEVAYPAQSITLMNKELKSMETDYLALFKGKRYLSEESYSFYVVPEADKPIQSYGIVKFSEQKGISKLSSNNGKTISLNIKTNGLTDVLKSKIPSENSMGVFYRIPESGRVWVEYNHTSFAETNLLFPQLGVVEVVNTNKTLFAIDPKTGMLKAIEIK